MIRARTTPGPMAIAPIHPGRRPHWFFVMTICAAVGACANSDANQVTSPVVLGMTTQLAPVYDDGEMQLYQVQLPVELPVRRWEDVEVQGLPRTDPYPRTPFLKASDVRLEIRYTLTNLDDQPRTILLMLDPWNEFVRYKPGLVVAEEMSLPNRSGLERRMRLEPKARVVGVLTNDDMTELATDLATAQNVLRSPPQDPNANVAGIMNRVFDFQNRSNVSDPIVSPFIPEVIAGLSGFDLGLRMEEQGTVAVEIVIDITDLNGNRVIPAGRTGTRIGMPGRIISPPGARLLN